MTSFFSPAALLRVVAPGAGFRGDTRSEISLCHDLSPDSSAAVTDLGENYVQTRMQTNKRKKRSSPQNSGGFGRNAVRDQNKRKSHHRKLVEFSAKLRFYIIKWCDPKMVTPWACRPP